MDKVILHLSLGHMFAVEPNGSRGCGGVVD
jgi:hypothetical protein